MSSTLCVDRYYVSITHVLYTRFVQPILILIAYYNESNSLSDNLWGLFHSKILDTVVKVSDYVQHFRFP